MKERVVCALCKSRLYVCMYVCGLKWLWTNFKHNDMSINPVTHNVMCVCACVICLCVVGHYFSCRDL